MDTSLPSGIDKKGDVPSYTNKNDPALQVSSDLINLIEDFGKHANKNRLHHAVVLELE